MPSSCQATRVPAAVNMWSPGQRYSLTGLLCIHMCAKKRKGFKHVFTAGDVLHMRGILKEKPIKCWPLQTTRTSSVHWFYMSLELYWNDKHLFLKRYSLNWCVDDDGGERFAPKTPFSIMLRSYTTSVWGYATLYARDGGYLIRLKFL